MSEPSFLRAAGWVSSEILPDPVCVIGVGATGSHIALLAAKMGFTRFKIWDADVVEDHNLPNQTYDTHHIGWKKVDALEDVLKRFNPAIQVEKHPYFFKAEHKDLLDGPLILTVDTMAARKEIAGCFEGNPMVQKVFETRLGFDLGELNIVDNMNMDECRNFKASLIDDNLIPDGPCNLRICTTLVCLVAAYAVHNLCAMYVAGAAEKVWERKKKTVFNLSPILLTYAI